MWDNEHISYDRIAEDQNKWLLTEVEYRQFKKHQWVVTEKIHGANFCIMFDGKQIRCAKRKQFLEPGEDFFGHLVILEQIYEKIFSIYQNLVQKYPNTTLVAIYGELFGGSYNHPQVDAIPSIYPVQTGVEYSPSIVFSAFDIAYTTSQERIYLNYQDFTEVVERNSLFYCKPLFTGSYQQALQFNERFPSTIPKQFGLPEIPNNLAEGVVIKPVVPLYVPTKKGSVRAILKKKIAEFSENQKFHEAQKWGTSSQWEAWKYSVEAMLTENRIHSAISKTGQVKAHEAKKIQELCELVVADIVEELAMGEGQQEILVNIQQMVRQYVLDYFSK